MDESAMETSLYHLLIGCNLGDRKSQLTNAVNQLSSLGQILGQSHLYETEPWGYPDQPWFYNQCIALSTSLEASDLLQKCKAIEVQAGRTEGEKWHARHLDIDILLWGAKVFSSENLIIPHPLLGDRNFALIPLMEIAPQQIHPKTGLTIEEMFLVCRDQGEVYILNADEQDNSL